MFISIVDNVHLKLGGEGDWFGITCYWLLIAHLLLFGSFHFFLLTCAYRDHTCLFGSIWMTLH